MREKFKLRNQMIFSLFLIVLLNCCSLNLDFLNLNSRNEKNAVIFEKTNIRTSKISERIIISNNWSDARDAGICTGFGTFSDPYIIEDLIIDGGGFGTGILIASKKVYFRIENCTIFNCENAIRMQNSCNGTLLNNNCTNNDNGIYLDGWTDLITFTYEQYLTFYCMNNTLTNNTINNNEQYGVYMRHSDNNSLLWNNINQNEYGIFLDYLSDNNTIIGNSLIKNECVGIYLRNSEDNIIKNNSMISCGYYSDEYNAFLYNIIDTTNLVNEGHLYFYANRTDLNGVNFSNAGQIYLVNCSNSSISYLDLSDGSVSISLFYCSNIRILHNNLSSNYFFGICARGCDKIFIKNNSIDFNNEGLELRDFNNSKIIDNTINNNFMYGIYLSDDYNNSFANNFINSNGFRGIRMFGFCCYNNFTNNRFIGNSTEGLSFALYSCYNIISGNIFKGNLMGVYCDSSSGYNLFYENFFIANVDFHTNGRPDTNNWNNSEIGNYWDDYNGIDADNNGIGDIPYNVSDSPLIQDFLPIVDDDVPEINILSPSNNSVFGNTAPIFVVRVKEKFIDEMWYTLDSGIHNYTFKNNGTIDETAWSALLEGDVNLVFYAKDKVGHTAFKEITIYKRFSNQNPALIIILSTVFGTIAIIAVGVIILIWKKYK